VTLLPDQYNIRDLPLTIRKEIATFARKLARDHRALLVSDP
jgi:hypothetical protein